MRVTLLVDALGPNPGGIGRYTWELCKGLAERRDLVSLFFGRGRLLRDPGQLVRGERPREVGQPFHKVRGWLERRSLAGSIIHAPNYFLPRFVERGVVTAHDLSVFRYPETHPVERIKAFEMEFERSLRCAAHIITDTETVRFELMRDFNVKPERVTSVHLGVDERFEPQDRMTLAVPLARIGLSPGDYALCVSTLEPRKKIAELLSAWRRLPSLLRERFPLVLAGGSGWRNEALKVDVARGVAEGWLRHLGYVEESELPVLYAGAALFLYPSIYEGFGLPPLEAMASGVPVIVANRSCLPEVCGDAAEYIDPEDQDDMLAAIVRVLSDEPWREAAAQRGLHRARQFTWQRCVEDTVAIYHDVAEQV